TRVLHAVAVVVVPHAVADAAARAEAEADGQIRALVDRQRDRRRARVAVQIGRRRAARGYRRAGWRPGFDGVRRRAQAGEQIAAVDAGRRGLQNGVIERPPQVDDDARVADFTCVLNAVEVQVLPHVIADLSRAGDEAEVHALIEGEVVGDRDRRGAAVDRS